MKRKISLFTYSCIVSIINLVLFNIPFFKFAVSHNSLSGFPLLFLMGSLVVVMLALNFMMTYLAVYLLKLAGRILVAILTLVSAVAEYFVFTYGVMMDEIMLGNVFNTRYSEASGFISWTLILYFVLCGVLPALFILLQPIDYESGKKFGISCGGSLGLILLLILANFKQTLWIGQYDTELGGLIMPWSYVVNTCRIISINHSKNEEEILLPDGALTDQEKTAVVLVIGESARKANFQLYGYGRETNPQLSRQPDLHVLQAQSCGTYTTAGCRAILEPENSGKLYEILPNYAYRTGVDVVWRTYNWGQPPVHVPEFMNDKDLAKIYPDARRKYDELLYTGLRERIEKSDRDKVLVVLHTNSSHGPEYYERYPKEFEHFTPVPSNVEESNKELDKLVNAYDNTIVYTDHLLSSLIDTLRNMEGWNTAMVYISDHGESLGENGLFMHGLPMNMAPKTQYEIPFLVWLSSDFRTLKADLPETVDQHYIFHSVIDLLSIQSPAYKEELDIFSLPDR